MLVDAVRVPVAPLTAGLRVSTVASHVLGELKYQVHCGWAVPAVACTA